MTPVVKSPISSLCELLSRSLSGLDYRTGRYFIAGRELSSLFLMRRRKGAGIKLSLGRTKNGLHCSCHLISSLVIHYKLYVTGMDEFAKTLTVWVCWFSVWLHTVFFFFFFKQIPVRSPDPRLAPRYEDVERQYASLPRYEHSSAHLMIQDSDGKISNEINVGEYERER